MENIKDNLPNERPYIPSLSKEKLQNLAMLPGPVADSVIRIGTGQATAM